MRIKTLAPLLFGRAVTSTRPPRPEMVAIVRGTFEIVPNGTVKALEGIPQIAQGRLMADVFREGDDERAGECLYASDFAAWKPRAEVLLTGLCYAPSGKPHVECLARLAVGAWSKTLRVTGDRHWDGQRISAPKGFTTMPLDYAHAFGGPGYAKNPVGKGFDGKELPNIEHQRGLVLSKGDRPDPAGFAPQSPNWPARAGKVGKKYDGDYRRTRAPYYAEDFDWAYFQAAPEDQWLEGYLRGDEEIALHNLHPEAPIVTTRLPGIRARVLVRDTRGRSREVPLKLDTLLVDTEKLRVTLTWRGLDAVGEADLSDVAYVIVDSERLDEPSKPFAHYAALLERFEEDPVGIRDQLPEDLRALVDGGSAAPDAGLDPISALVAKKLGGVATEAQEALRASIARAIEQAGPEAKVHEKVNAVAKAMEGPLDDAPPPVIPAAPGGKPRLYLRPEMREVAAKIELAKERAREHGGALPKEVAEAEARLRDPKLLEVDPTLRPATTNAPGPGADLSGQDLSGEDLRGVDLRGAKLEGAVLIGANLAGVDLTGASLRGAMLFKIDLRGATLRGADLSLVNAARAILDEADLTGSTLDDAYFKSASLARARLEGAKGTLVGFAEADLRGARAAGVRLDQSDFSKARLDDADLTAATITRSKLHETIAPRASLRRATLDRTAFVDADLSGGKLGGARGERTIWLRAKLAGADLSRSWFRGGHFVEADASGANLFGADLRDARFGKAILVDASFLQANLFGADLSGSALGHTIFAKANLYEAKLLGAVGPGCTFEGAVLDRVLFDGRAG